MFSGSAAPGTSMYIWSSPCWRIVGSVRPNLSMRELRLSMARFIASAFSAAERLCPSFWDRASRSAWMTALMPPERSRPSLTAFFCWAFRSRMRVR